MQFSKGYQTFCITSQESSLTQIEDTSTFQMQKLLLQESIVGAVLYLMETDFSQSHSMENSMVDQHFEHLTELQQQGLHFLLEKFEVLFSTPSTLPPNRVHKHIVPLIEGNKTSK